MSEWRDTNLGEVVEVKYGKDHKHLAIGKIPAYGSGGVMRFVDTALYDDESILIPRKGSLNNIIYESKPFWTVDTMFWSKIDKTLAHPKFLYYQLTEIDYMNLNVGSAVPSLTVPVINAIEISLPPLQEQKAIASVLSSLDDKIDLLHRQNTTLERMAETLFRQWFVEEAQGDWEEISFGKFVAPKKGKNITKADAIDGIYPVIAGGLTPSCFHNKYNTNAPVITISASGANAGFVCLHHSPVWSSDSSYIDDTITKYVYFCYVFLKYNQSILTDKQEGSAQPHIYPSHIMDLGALNYPVHLIETFENQVESLFEKIKLNQKQIQTLEKLRDNLLPKLMSGEVRVL
ncbi:MAG: restriction endonuclease subunit S [Methylotenera sp.]